MKNFKQHRLEVIEDFCTRFKTITWKSIWGIDLLCNSKSKEIVWLHMQLLKFQELSQCISGPASCNLTNPVFTIVKYPVVATKTSVKFPLLYSPLKTNCNY